MPVRSQVEYLPEEIRQALNERLLANAFSDYRGLVDWLTEQGFVISRGALHRYGKKFQERAEMVLFSAEQAKVLVAQLDDEGGAMNEALLRLATEQVFTMLMDSRSDDGKVTLTPSELSKLLVGVGNITKASGIQQKRAQRVREDIEQRVRAAAKTADGIMKKEGIPAAVAKVLREEFLGAIKGAGQ